jgi:hypothetical protein
MPVAIVTIGDAELEVTTFTATPANGEVDDTGNIVVADYSGNGRQARAPISFTATIQGRRRAQTDTEDLTTWTVGFIQNVASVDRRALLTRASDGQTRIWRETPKDPMPLYDGSDRPWYKATAKATFGAATGGQVTITTTDSPAFRVPRQYPNHQLHGIDPGANDTYQIWVAARKGDELPRKLALLAWTCKFNPPATTEDNPAAACGDDQHWNLVGTPANQVEKAYTIKAS